MDRRRFLSLSVMSISLSSCSGGNKPETSSLAVVDSPVINNISDNDWQSFITKITGNVILPNNNAQYENARLVFNTRFDNIYPQAIVLCENDSDVISTLAFVQEHNLQVTPRCAGHSYTGYSTTHGLVIDVTPMNTINIAEEIVTIGAGARLVDVYDQLTKQGLSIPLGSCLSVGISGLTLGGGIGIVDRAYGLTCDTLLAVEIITANGNKLTCNDSENEDLFWALRGGGGGNFGVVTSFTFKTHTTNDVTVFEANYSFDDFEEVMAQWQTLTHIWPNEMWGQIIPSWLYTKKPTLYIRVFCLNSESDATPYWQEFINSINATAESIKVSTDSYRNTMLGTCSNTIAACHISTQFPEGKMPRSAFAASSDFFDEVIPPIGIKTLKTFIENSLLEERKGMIVFNMMAGVIDNLKPSDTAFVHRNSLFSTEYYTFLPVGSDFASIDSAQAWENSFREVMKSWSTGGAYVNYLDPLIENWQQAYYGDNYTRLAQIKQKYDKNRLFNLPQGIEPA